MELWKKSPNFLTVPFIKLNRSKRFYLFCFFGYVLQNTKSQKSPWITTMQNAQNIKSFFAKCFLQVSSICLILAFLFSSKGKSNQSTYIFLYKKPLYYVHLNGKKVCPQGTICIASSIVSDTNFMPTWQCGKEDMIPFFSMKPVCKA